MLKKIVFMLSLIIIKNIQADLFSIKFNTVEIQIKNKILYISLLDIQNLLSSDRLSDDEKIKLLSDHAKYLENFIYEELKQSIPSKINMRFERYKNQLENTVSPDNFSLNKNDNFISQKISNIDLPNNKSIEIVNFKINILLEWIKSKVTYIEPLD
ncbi:MAG: hypothetical protein ABIF12_01555 [bacterium]